MRIEKLEIEGFRSLRKVSWQPGVLNIIIGPNGSGKSNLLHLLELISVSANGRLGKYVQDWGGMSPLLWDGVAKSISVAVKTSSDKQSNLTYELELVRIGNSSAYRIGRELLADYAPMEQKQRDSPIKYIERNDTQGTIFDENENAIIADERSLAIEETLLSTATGPFVINKQIPPFRQQLASWAVYHDVRVDRLAPIRMPVVTRSERVVDNDGQNLIHILHTLYSTDRQFEEDINSAMYVAYGDDFDKLVFPPDADQRIQLRIRWKSLKREVSAFDISDGTLRLLFLLAVLANPDLPSIVAIDEPENGLHPSMMPIIAEYAYEAATRSQVIITTHSAELLDAFTKFKPTTSVIKCVEGETVLTQVNVEQLEYWIKNNTLGNMYRFGQLEDM